MADNKGGILQHILGKGSQSADVDGGEHSDLVPEVRDHLLTIARREHVYIYLWIWKPTRGSNSNDESTRNFPLLWLISAELVLKHSVYRRSAPTAWLEDHSSETYCFALEPDDTSEVQSESLTNSRHIENVIGVCLIPRTFRKMY